MTTPCTGINVTQLFFQDERLIGVSLIFDTKGKDKDHDTALAIRVCNAEGIVVAERTGITGHWIEKSRYLVSLDLKNSPTKAEISAGSVHLQIHPNGNDSWEFSYNMWMFFSDQTTFEQHWEGKSLTQEDSSTVDTWTKEQAD
jgi:hypothetical protein